MVQGFTAQYNVNRLVHVETFEKVSDAIQREKELKKWRRSKKIALIEEANPKWEDLSEWISKSPIISTSPRGEIPCPPPNWKVFRSRLWLPTWMGFLAPKTSLGMTEVTAHVISTSLRGEILFTAVDKRISGTASHSYQDLCSKTSLKIAWTKTAYGKAVLRLYYVQ